jgi:hypothetical protein
MGQAGGNDIAVGAVRAAHAHLRKSVSQLHTYTQITRVCPDRCSGGVMVPSCRSPQTALVLMFARTR